MTRQSNGLPLSGFTESHDAEHAADVEHLDDVAGLHALGHVARVAEQRLAMAERARNDVALADLGHAAAGELERVVGGLVGEDLHDHDHAFLGRECSRWTTRTSLPRPQAWVTEAILSTTTVRISSFLASRTRMEHARERNDLRKAQRILRRPFAMRTRHTRPSRRP